MNKTIQQRAMKHSLLLTAGTLLLECLVSEVVLHDFMIVVPYIPIWGPLSTITGRKICSLKI